MILGILNKVGSVAINVCNEFGRYGEFVFQTFLTIFTRRIKLQKLFVQMERIGVDSLPISILIGIFAGAVMTLQTYYGFNKFGSENMIGPVVALSLTRELGPVLTGLMVTGRSGSMT